MRRVLKPLFCTFLSAAMVFGMAPNAVPLTMSVQAEEVSAAPVTKNKVRTIVTTDGEVDDQDSFIRLMLYLNDMDVEGLIMSSSTFHYSGIPTETYKGTEKYQQELYNGVTQSEAKAAEEADMKEAEQQGEDPESARHYTVYPYRWTGQKWLYDVLENYDKVDENLRKHDPDFPTAEELRAITHIGNIENEGDYGEGRTTEGSEFMKEILLDDTDDRPIYIQTWGGTNTTAQALYDIEKEYKGTPEWETIYNRICEKTKLYIILNQDDSFNDYIKVHWPDIFVIHDGGTFWKFAYQWTSVNENLTQKLRGKWFSKNIKKNHGPLLSMYRTAGDGTVLPGEDANEQRCSEDLLPKNGGGERYGFISEGDSPSFFYLLDTGLRSLEDPTYGGWGGRFGEQTEDGVTTYENIAKDYNPYTEQWDGNYGLTRWFDDIQDDFAARADWCVAENYEDANHRPTVSVKEGIDLTAAPGERVILHADTEDPDGDYVNLKWYQYFEADTYDGDSDGKIKLTGDDTDIVSCVIPEDAMNGDTIHLIVEAQDEASAPMKHYQRVIIKVEGRQEIGSMELTAPEDVDINNLVYERKEEASPWGGTRVTEPEIQLALDVKDTEGNTLTEGKTFTYTSSDEKIAEVENDGNVTLKGKVGTVEITATANDGSDQSASITMTVTKNLSDPQEGTTQDDGKDDDSVPSTKPAGTTERPDSQTAPDSQKAPDTSNAVSSDQTAAEGTTVTVGGATYRVMVSGAEAEYVAPVNKKTTIIKIPAYVTIQGRKYAVTSVAKKTAKNNKKVVKIVIGKNVKTIGKSAFYGCKSVKKLIIKTKKLTKKSVGNRAFGKLGAKNYREIVVKVPKAKKKLYTTILIKKGLNKQIKIKG